MFGVGSGADGTGAWGLITIQDNALGAPGGFFLRNGLNQNFQESTGELWQTPQDRSETRDLIAQEPKRAAELIKLWNAWSTEVKARQRSEP